VAATPTEEIVALMRTLTISQQSTVLKTARGLADQNRSKPQKSNRNVGVSSEKVNMARAPQNSGVSPGTQVSSEKTPRYALLDAAEKCPVCHQPCSKNKLQKHMKERHKNAAKSSKPSITSPQKPKALGSNTPPAGAKATPRDTEWLFSENRKKSHLPSSPRSEPVGQKWAFSRYSHTGR
jgi:hypothetical protein